MDESSQAGPSLEELVDNFIEDARDPDVVAEGGPSLGLLEDALKRRLELLNGVDGDKAARTGAALSRLGTFAARIGAMVTAEGEEELETMSVGAMLDELAVDLTYAINGAGAYAELSVLDNAKAVRDLAEAYVRLGGSLGVQAQPLPPVVDNEDLLARIWRRLNDSARYGTGLIDELVAVVRAELEAPATEERVHPGQGAL